MSAHCCVCYQNRTPIDFYVHPFTKRRLAIYAKCDHGSSLVAVGVVREAETEAQR